VTSLTHWSRHSWYALGLLLAGAAACSYGYSVWVIPGSTTNHLVLGLATEKHGTNVKGLRFFYVEPCDVRDDREFASRTWQIEANASYDGGGPELAHLTYGVVPSGFQATIPSKPLKPGCYYASASATYGHSGGGMFMVRPGGMVSDLTDEEDRARGERWTAQHKGVDSIAMTRCALGYRRARSWADSMRVDQQVWYDTAVFPPTLTCKFLCTMMGPEVQDEQHKRPACHFLKYNSEGRGIN
jgi:hypothetical protein